jgi:N utilization substance protein A
MSSDLNVMEALRALAQEKGIDEYDMLDKLEQSLATTYARILDLENPARVTIDRETGRIYVYERILDPEWEGEPEDAPVIEEHDVTPPDVSRIAAQNAKSVITSIVRDAAREKIFEEYADRIGESITGTIQQSDNRYTLVKLREGVEAEMPQKEQPPNERYSHNERIKAYVIEVRKGQGSEPPIVVSRTHPGFIRRLFEIEVPEVYDGIVEIKSIAREAGARSKVAVSSREPGLDPVGACVGPKGSRVRMIVGELRGERIDVIPWHEDPVAYVAASLSPAKVDRVIIDPDSHTATVVVPNDQLSLAIGKEGQNARLAAKLTGWRIDIKSSATAAEQGISKSGDSSESAEEFDGRCCAVTSSGVRCRNQARPDSFYCGLHEKEAAAE